MKPEAIQRLKAAIPPLEFYRLELPGLPPPKKSNGWTRGGACPYHADHRPNNFRVHLDSGAFRCFACGARGSDVIAFARLRYGLSFADAVRRLADAWGVTI